MRTSLILVALIVWLGRVGGEPQEQSKSNWIWKDIGNTTQVRIYQDSSGEEHWPIPNSLWSYFEYKRLVDSGVPTEEALEWSKPFMSGAP